MTKAAISHLTKCLAVEWGTHGITVNAVAPTFIATPGTEPALADPDFRADVDRAHRRPAPHRHADGGRRRRRLPGLARRLADHRRDDHDRRRLDRAVNGVPMWGDAFAELSAARREGELGVEDLERLAVAAYMVGRDDDCEDAWVRAHHAWLRRGEAERAARCAFGQALGLFFRGELAPAMGWVARGGRVLQDSRRDGVEHAWLRMLTALPLLFEGDAAAAYPRFVEAGEMADRFGDADATMFARLGRGDALIRQGRIADGMALLDEVMVAVTADEVAPMLAGIAYCQVIALCQAVFDLRRAREWTDALTRWCDSQPDLVPFRGNCLVHRCEILQLQGAWTDALDAARRACEWLAGPPDWDSLGSAHYQLAEIQRLRGELARGGGVVPPSQPRRARPRAWDVVAPVGAGASRSRCSPAIRRALDEAQDPIARSRLLPACVEIMLEAERRPRPRGRRPMSSTASPRRSTRRTCDALAAQASGAVLLAEGDPRAALTKLRRRSARGAISTAPHQAARVRLLIGVACRELGDGAQCRARVRRGAWRARGAWAPLPTSSDSLG